VVDEWDQLEYGDIPKSAELGWQRLAHCRAEIIRIAIKA
jgi:hypothetical protein